MREGGDFSLVLPRFVSPWDGEYDITYVLRAVVKSTGRIKDVEAYYPHSAPFSDVDAATIRYKDETSVIVRREKLQDGMDNYVVRGLPKDSAWAVLKVDIERSFYDNLLEARVNHKASIRNESGADRKESLSSILSFPADLSPYAAQQSAG